MKGLKMTLKQKALLNTIKFGSLFLGSIAAISFIAMAIGPEILALFMVVFLLIFAMLLMYEVNLAKLEADAKYEKKEPTINGLDTTK